MPKRWSTKNLIVSRPASATETGVGWFECTDDYSVFHYSKMPDQIDGKGEALCRMAVQTLREVQAAGVPTHLIEFTPPNRLKVRLVRVIDPATGPLTPEHLSRLIPLQVICRNDLPPGASVFRRLEARTMTPGQLGLDEAPVPGQLLAEPFVEFSTKLEEIDRYISDDEAQQIAGLSDSQFAEVRALALRVNDVVTAHAESVGLVHADSKVEFGIDSNGEIILVDTAGTPDENRFLRHGFHVSKQVLRDYYHQRALEESVQRWAAEGRPRDQWPKPARAPADLIEAVSDLYKSVSNLWTGEDHFAVASVDEVIERVRTLQRRYMSTDLRP